MGSLLQEAGLVPSWLYAEAVSLRRLLFQMPVVRRDDELFVNEMKDMDIYVPNQDASWELEPNAFQELLHKHNQCDHPNCICPKGRTHDDDDAVN